MDALYSVSHTFRYFVPSEFFFASSCSRFLFMFFTILISLLSSHCDGACDKPFTCGIYSLHYPFGAKNSGCGDPTLQLDCDRNYSMPILNISGHQFYILEPLTYFEGNSSRIMKIIEKNLWGYFCNPFSSNNTAQFWSSPQFQMGDYYKNITLWDCDYNFFPDNATNLLCNDTWYYMRTPNSSLTARHCGSQVQLPVRMNLMAAAEMQMLNTIIQEGFDIKWSLSEGCEDCVSRNHTCRYDITTMRPYCEIDARNYSFQSDALSESAFTIILVCSVGGVALAAVVLLLFISYWRKIKHDNPRSISKVEMFLHKYVDDMPTRYSYSKLKKITNNFSDKLGEGGFGVVYKGRLPRGKFVAVKMLDRSKQSENQFMNEVATIGTIHHIHLVRLLGYCFEGHISALVYEYMANGSLDKFILARKDEDHILNWDQLYSIALGAARGVAYLHDECHSRIIHFDIKPHNILLNEQFIAKVADFGLAKLCGREENHVSVTVARGTPGYVAPEVWSRNLGPVTDKSDVYGFGMMLLEMVGGRKNIDIQMSRSSQFYFPDWVIKVVERGELRTRLRERELSDAEEAKARSLTKVGLWCIQYNSTDRPSMMEVVHMLEGDANDIPDPPTPINARPGSAPIPGGEESSIAVETTS